MGVYPRVGGETRSLGQTELSGQGLSPRGRGNPPRGDAARVPIRSIPAWAGKPRAALAAVVGEGVYPRVGGETVGTVGEAAAVEGLSPRGRGNRPLQAAEEDLVGSIPAWAGKPRAR